MVKRLNLPYEILSDGDLKLKTVLSFPTLNVSNMILLKRLTMVIQEDRIIKVFCPEFPLDESANTNLNWLLNR